MLRRYPADHRLDPRHAARLDLGGGLALDVYADDRPSVALGYRDVWIQLAGWIRPPAAQHEQVTASIEDAIELVSDGRTVWAAE
jgi:hypothetical protein